MIDFKEVRLKPLFKQTYPLAKASDNSSRQNSTKFRGLPLNLLPAQIKPQPDADKTRRADGSVRRQGDIKTIVKNVFRRREQFDIFRQTRGCEKVEREKRAQAKLVQIVVELSVADPSLRAD